MNRYIYFISALYYLIFLSFVPAQTIPDSKEKIEQKIIDETNRIIQEKGYKWKAGVTSISHLSDEQFKKLCGIKITKEESDVILAKQDSMYKAYKSSKKNKKNNILTNPNWQGYMSPVEDQGYCGNCWAHAAKGVTEGLLHAFLGYNAEIILDAMDITNNAECGSCGGTAWPPCGLNYIYTNKVRCKQGINSFPNFDHAYYTVSSWSPNNPSIWEIKAALQNSPVLAGMFVYRDFKLHNTSEIYQRTSNELIGGHAVVIVDYNDEQEYWLCKNSWGTNWGESGYFKIKYGECGIDSWANITGSVNSWSCFAKLIPNFMLLYDASNYSVVTNEWAYILGNTNINNSATIPSGSTLQINSGAVLTFNPGVSLTVNGAYIRLFHTGI